MEEFQLIFNISMGVGVPVGLYYIDTVNKDMKALREKHDLLKDEHSSLRESVAREYVRRTEMDAMSVRIENRFDAMEKKMEAGFQRIFDRLEQKADK